MTGPSFPDRLHASALALALMLESFPRRLRTLGSGLEEEALGVHVNSLTTTILGKVVLVSLVLCVCIVY